MTTIEIQRKNVTPREFWNACVRACKKINESMPVDSFDEWKNDHDFNYCMHMNLYGSYTGILEFNFEDDNKGWGYFYMAEVA